MSKVPDKSGGATGPSEGALVPAEDSAKPSQRPTTNPGQAGPSGISGRANENKYMRGNKRNAKTQTDNQARLMQVFQNLALLDDPAPTNVSELVAVEEEPADIEQRNDDAAACSSRNTNKPKRRKRKNRKAKKARAYMISGVAPIEPKKKVPAPAVPAPAVPAPAVPAPAVPLPVKPTLSEQAVVPETSHSCLSSPRSLSCDCSLDMNLNTIEGSETDYFLSSDDNATIHSDTNDEEDWSMFGKGY